MLSTRECRIGDVRFMSEHVVTMCLSHVTATLNHQILHLVQALLIQAENIWLLSLMNVLHCSNFENKIV